MRELDELLCEYLRSRYHQAQEQQKWAFCRLLALPDPELIGYLLGNRPHQDPVVSDVIESIRSRAEARP